MTAASGESPNSGLVTCPVSETTRRRQDWRRRQSVVGGGVDAAMVNRIMFGGFIDLTGRKQAEEGRELPVGEVGHRFRNLLASITSTRASSPPPNYLMNKVS